MNRRKFLTGCLATAGFSIIGTPPQALEEAISFDEWFLQWQRAAISVLVEHQSNLFIFGCSALRYTDNYPYVEVVDPATLYIKPEIQFKGLL